jgi:predicted phosphodiesterase
MKWTPEEEKLLARSLGKLNYTEITSLINSKHSEGVAGFTSERTESAVRRKILRDKVSPTETKDYSDDWDFIIQTAKEYRSKSVKLDLGLTDSKHKKIISFSDLHLPFFLWEDMEKALKQHADADVIVLNGDILDAYIFSTFSKSKNIAAIKEYKMAFDLVHYLSDNFEKVVLVSGNHDYRTSRALKMAGFDKDASSVYGGDLLFRIANGEKLNDQAVLEEKIEFDNVIYQRSDSWYVRIGQTIFCHPSGFASKYPGATVVKLLDHFSERMNDDDFDSIVVGHTHKIYKGVVSGKLLIEQGAMAHRLPYQFQADLKFKNAMNGYAIIYQDASGNTNFNDSTPIYIGSHLPTKKGLL